MSSNKRGRKSFADTPPDSDSFIPIRFRDAGDNKIMAAVQVLERKYGNVTGLCEKLGVSSRYIYAAIKNEKVGHTVAMKMVELLEGQFTLTDLAPGFAAKVEKVKDYI